MSKKKNNKQWEAQIESAKETLRDPNTPDGIKELLGEWLDYNSEPQYIYGYVVMANGEVHTEEEHIEQEHEEHECYQVKLKEI